jgi:hypothetical protein
MQSTHSARTHGGVAIEAKQAHTHQLRPYAVCTLQRSHVKEVLVAPLRVLPMTFVRVVHV